MSFEELLSLRLSDHFALVVGCINNNWFSQTNWICFHLNRTERCSAWSGNRWRLAGSKMAVDGQTRPCQTRLFSWERCWACWKPHGFLATFSYFQFCKLCHGARVHYDLIPLQFSNWSARKGREKTVLARLKYRKKKNREVHSLPQIPHRLEQGERRSVSGSPSPIWTNFLVPCLCRNGFFCRFWTEWNIEFLWFSHNFFSCFR